MNYQYRKLERQLVTRVAIAQLPQKILVFHLFPENEQTTYCTHLF